MTKIKYQAIDSRGTVHKRTTTHRIYTHAVVAHIAAYPAGINKYGIPYEAGKAHDVVEWAGRADLARNVANRWLRHPAGIEVEILEAKRV